MFLIVMTTLVLLGSLFYAYLKYHFSYWERKGVPHEKPTLILGNMKGIRTKLHFSDLFKRVYKQFKGQSPIAGMFFFFRKVVLIMDCDLAKLVLTKDFKDFHDRGTYSNVKDDPLTGHLISLEGDQWNAMRSTLTPVFTIAKIRSMFPAVASICENLVSVYEEMSDRDSEGKVDITELNARYTTDVIGTCAFGLDCNSLKNPDSEFRRKGREFFNKPRLTKLTRALVTTSPSLARKLRIKLFRDDITEFFLNCVKQTIDYRVKNNIKRNDFMDVMISLKAEDTTNVAKCENQEGIDLSQGLTLEQITAQAFAFFIAGFNSSSTTISFCLYELAKNAEIQERLRDEIMTHLEESDDEKLTFEMIQSMSYLEMVIEETLRIYPVIANIIRKANNDFHIPDSKLVIEKGCTVLVPLTVIHHDPDIYPEPEKFDPERFTKQAKAQRHQYSYMPFGKGPRNCIGTLIAHMQTKVALISLLRKFRFSKSSLTEDKIEISKASPDVMPKGPIYLKVEKL